MDSALIISRSEKSFSFFTGILSAVPCSQIVTLQSGGEARRLILERDFDLVIINSPLMDESGERLARHIASRGTSQVILVVKNEYFDEMSSATENEGVLTVSKPVSKTMFWSVLKLAKSAQNRIRIMKDENNRLNQKIEDIKIVDRAKCVLIAYLRMDEQEAHKHLEKQAMERRMTRREVAEEILKIYEN